MRTAFPQRLAKASRKSIVSRFTADFIGVTRGGCKYRTRCPRCLLPSQGARGLLELRHKSHLIRSCEFDSIIQALQEKVSHKVEDLAVQGGIPAFRPFTAIMM